MDTNNKWMFRGAHFFTMLLLLLMLSNVYGQVVNKKPFGLRTSELAPEPYKNKEIYNLRGDFTMIGNASLFDKRLWGNKPSKASDGNDNNSSMDFYKLAEDEKNTTIKNSTSSTLVHPSGYDQSCTKIVYVGLYWSGRGDEAVKDILGNGLDKKKVKIKLPGQTSYQDVIADGIYSGAGVDGTYASYADITDKVLALGNAAWGKYNVANVATTVGNGGDGGYYGGWGMVVIYENPQMKWRDITVFDGYSFIESKNGGYHNGELNVSGFRAAQSGAINVKMGMMAGEGDKGIEGDSFEIKLRNTTNWEKLSHSGNKIDNFFNSSVLVSPNTRTPSYTNNYGTDIAIFNLDNRGNRYIGNNDTSTSFRFGTKQDTYIIYNITFAVDAYVPLVEAENKVLTSGISHNSEVVPGQSLDYEISLKNNGSEAVEEGRLEISIPPTMHYVSSSINQSLDIKGTVSWSHPNSTDPNATPGGTLTWVFDKELGISTLNKILGKLKYTLRISDDCTLLTSSVSDCMLNTGLNGKVSGTGVLSKSEVDVSLVRGYSEGVCSAPIYEDLKLKIVLDNDFMASCPTLNPDGAKVFKAFCGNTDGMIKRSDIANAYPLKTKFYSQVPTDPGYESSLITGDFPVSITGNKYYAIIPGGKETCYLKLSAVLDNISSVPTVVPVDACYGVDYEIDAKLSDEGRQQGLGLYYFDSPNATVPLASVPAPTEVGVHTYYVAEGTIGQTTSCFGEKIKFTININDIPVVGDLQDNWELCSNTDSSIVLTIGATDTITWQYVFDTQPIVWQDLTASSFPNNMLVPIGNKLTVSHAGTAIDRVFVRAKITNSTGCFEYSDIMELSIKSCNAISNPTLPSKAIDKSTSSSRLTK